MGLYLSPSFEVLSYFFFICSFTPTFFLLSSWNFDDRNVGSFVIFPQVPEALFFTVNYRFSVCFLFLLKLDEFSCFALKFSDSVFCCLYYFSHLVSFNISLTLFFSFIIFIWFFSIASILFWYFLFSQKKFVIDCGSIFIIAAPNIHVPGTGDLLFVGFLFWQKNYV